jgi:hypothetical protein
MNSKTQWKLLLAGSAAAVMLTLGTAAVYPQISQAADTTTAAPAQGQRGQADSKIDRSALLADALGIPTADLQAAYKKAASAGLDQAVKDGLLTQTQADTLRQRMDAAGATDFGHFGFGGMERFGGNKIDSQALLADALGIKVDVLQAAEAKAEQAELDQAVKDGTLTQDQADLAKAERAFRTYQVKQQPTFEEELAKAVTAGAITQAQSDLLLKNQQAAPAFGGRGFGPGMDGAQQGAPGFGPGMDGPRGHGRGGPRGMAPGADGTQNDSGTQLPNFGAPQSDVAPTTPAAGL